MYVPTERKPISLWRNREEAFLDVIKGIRQVVKTFHEDLRNQKQNIHVMQNIPLETLFACEQALQREPRNPSLHVQKGDILFHYGHFAEALLAYTTATELAPDYNPGHQGKAMIYEQFVQQCDEQSKIYKHLIQKSYNHIKPESI